MSETTGTAAAGWYDDPTGSAQKRWWDGTQWTDDVHDPAAQTNTAVATPTVSATTPVYNVYIWLIVLLPLVSMIAFATFDMSDYLTQSMASGYSGMPVFPPSYFLLIGLSWGLYLVTALLAFFDWRKLARDGYVRPFHWAWVFLSGTVYVIGRSVVARRRSGRGLLPIWIMIAVLVVGFVVAVVKIVDTFNVIWSNVQFS